MDEVSIYAACFGDGTIKLYKDHSQPLQSVTTNMRVIEQEIKLGGGIKANAKLPNAGMKGGANKLI